MVAYQFLLLCGLVVTGTIWLRWGRRDPRLPGIYAAAMLGAFLGAKVVYLAAEGWMFWDSPNRWTIFATGKTILGALLGGYAGVEWAKRLLKYQDATGDRFALVVPIGIIIGRIGCLLHGCCPGQICETSRWWTMDDAAGNPRWPSVPLEILFNVTALLAFGLLRRRHALTGQHFHLYLIGYGLFRFAHEFFRDTPRLAGAVSGYHLAALAVTALGLAGFLHRQCQSAKRTVVSDVA
ncbi:MAG: prolipoprotein diacylglyceryl transferase family protein [Chthoniobacteraceae bacterium]